MDPTGVLTPERISLIGVLLAVIFAFLKGWVHTDAEFKREVLRGDRWEKVALNLMPLAQNATGATRDAVKVAEKSLDVAARATTDPTGGGTPP